MDIEVKKIDGLNIHTFQTRKEMGQYVADAVTVVINNMLKEQDKVRIIFACAPSQSDFLDAFVQSDIEWERIESFHMDEYVGLGDASKSFAQFIKSSLNERVPIEMAHFIDPSTPESRQSYIDALTSEPIDIVCLGIGENGHLAFNDPDYADFHDHEILKEVQLDDVCRQQQVNDGCFVSLNEVPKSAVTLTIPVLMAPKYMFCTVPGSTKKEILKKLCLSPVTEKIPCTIMKERNNCWIYTDQKIDCEG